jgi:DNA-binding IclR family transcriptional regulator
MLIGGPTLRDIAQTIGVATTTLHRFETSQANPGFAARGGTLGSYIAYLENSGVRFLNSEAHRGVVLVHDRGGAA